MDQYVARICWNSKGWVHPTGESVNAERGTYVTETGYGHEEWLFNIQWVLNGWKYAFLQPVNRSYERVQGQTIDVRLYTIAPKREWFYVGRIPRCEVVTDDQAEAAWAAFSKRGWADDMGTHVRAVGGAMKGLRVGPRFIFNIRFRPEELELLDPIVPVGAADTLRKLRRYSLTLIKEDLKSIHAEWPDRRGQTRLHKTGKQQRKAVQSLVANLVERQLQNELFTILARQFGARAVVMEEGFTDVTLRVGGVVHLFEVKASAQPRKAIREALGQLLQYGFARESKGEKVGYLIVAAPGELDDPDRKYLEHLRTARGLPIHYVCLRRGTQSVRLPDSPA